MSKSVPRYTLFNGAVLPTFDADSAKPSGDWVKVSDYEALERELVEANEKIKQQALEYISLSAQYDEAVTSRK